VVWDKRGEGEGDGIIKNRSEQDGIKNGEKG